MRARGRASTRRCPPACGRSTPFGGVIPPFPVELGSVSGGEAADERLGLAEPADAANVWGGGRITRPEIAELPELGEHVLDAPLDRPLLVGRLLGRGAAPGARAGDRSPRAVLHRRPRRECSAAPRVRRHAHPSPVSQSASSIRPPPGQVNRAAGRGAAEGARRGYGKAGGVTPRPDRRARAAPRAARASPAAGPAACGGSRAIPRRGARRARPTSRGRGRGPRRAEDHRAQRVADEEHRAEDADRSAPRLRRDVHQQSGQRG